MAHIAPGDALSERTRFMILLAERMKSVTSSRSSSSAAILLTYGAVAAATPPTLPMVRSLLVKAMVPTVLP